MVDVVTLVVEAQHVFHDVQVHHLVDGGDFMYVRTHCGGYFKESALTLEPKEGVALISTKEAT